MILFDIYSLDCVNLLYDLYLNFFGYARSELEFLDWMLFNKKINYFFSKINDLGSRLDLIPFNHLQAHVKFLLKIHLDVSRLKTMGSSEYAVIITMHFYVFKLTICSQQHSLGPVYHAVRMILDKALRSGHNYSPLLCACWF